MATRSLTEVFILMRNNAIQNRHIFSEQMADDRMALVSRNNDIEMGKTSRLPPDWVDGVEENSKFNTDYKKIQFEVSRIKQKVKELAVLHDKHLNRPTLDDSMDEEHAIEIQTSEITQMFSRCQLLVHQISKKSRTGTSQEQKLTQNIVSSLARTLQDLSIVFKKSQSNYLKKLQTREERSKHFFGADLGGSSNLMFDEDSSYDAGFTDVQLMAVEDNQMMVQHREREISQIVHSINDLNEIFKDLATMVVDQGTILDRIDYNIEQTSTSVEQGLKQLTKAEKYQKKNRKMLCVMILFVIIIVVILLIIAKKAIGF